MNILLNSKPTQILSLIGLQNILLNFKGYSFAGLQTLTDARAKKTDNPFKDKIVLKESQLLVNVGFHYSNSLVNQAKRENVSTEFDVQPRKWGIRLPNSPLVEHKGNLYLEAKVEKVYSTRFTDIDGNELDKQDVLPFLPKKRESATQDRLEKKIYLRDFKLASIKKFAFDGKIYLVG
tara:strand:+ start:2219 stop:2752 length:534 start_codon:yes stop_codon:yes gene_type:complete